MRFWYSVKLIYQYIATGDPDPDLVDEHFIPGYRAWEESVLLVRAASFEAAWARAEEIVQAETADYTSIYGQPVTKRVHTWVDCFQVADGDDLQAEDGLEVYSNLFEQEDEQAVMEQFLVKDRSQWMLRNMEFRHLRG